MSQEGPKLLKNKPKKAQVIRASEAGGGSSKGASATSSAAPSSSSSVSAAAASYKMGGSPPPPPPQPPQESFARRYKFMWPLLLGVNLVVGVYYFTRTRNPTAGKDAEVTTNASPAAAAAAPTTSTAAAPLDDKPAPVLEPVRIREPIPDYQQRDLFKWILDEKRKVKPKDPEEKKRLDEEKAILKQFIRAKSIPSL